MGKLENYIKELRASGKRAFTIEQIISIYGMTKASAFNGLSRLKKKGAIVSPVSGLYVIVPPENQAMGCIPAGDLVPLVMDHWNLEYYVCLLTAALYHGASHQKPQQFQVMTTKQRQPIHCGSVYIDFMYKKTLDALPTNKIVVATGYLNVSSPELTAMDLFLYPSKSGGLNHIATVLAELVDVIDPAQLIKLAKKSKTHAWIQRLGYVLEKVIPVDEEKNLQIVAQLHAYIQTIKPAYILLAPEVPRDNAILNKKWKIIENTTVESDV